MYQNAVELSHEYIERVVCLGDTVVDATAGNGNDTLFLANLVGENGKVFAFDIQDTAIKNTKKRLSDAGVSERCTLITDGHQNMKKYVEYPVKAIMFNFGYLPGGDHRIFTVAETSIEAIRAAMELISDDGIITLAIYYGGDSGFEEHDALLEFLKTISNNEYSVLYHDFINYPNCPPIVVSITRSKKACKKRY